MLAGEPLFSIMFIYSFGIDYCLAWLGLIRTLLDLSDGCVPYFATLPLYDPVHSLLF